MMAQMQSSRNTWPPVSAVYNFSSDESSLSQSKAHVEKKPCFELLEGGSAGRASGKKRTGNQAVSEMPLWPSLKGLQTATEKAPRWKEGVKKALNYRSAFIFATVLSLAAFGFILTI